MTAPLFSSNCFGTSVQPLLCSGNGLLEWWCKSIHSLLHRVGHRWQMRSAKRNVLCRVCTHVCVCLYVLYVQCVCVCAAVFLTIGLLYSLEMRGESMSTSLVVAGPSIPNSSEIVVLGRPINSSIASITSPCRLQTWSQH